MKAADAKAVITMKAVIGGGVEFLHRILTPAVAGR